jgi:hypothetical protein
LAGRNFLTNNPVIAAGLKLLKAVGDKRLSKNAALV